MSSSRAKRVSSVCSLPLTYTLLPLLLLPVNFRLDPIHHILQHVENRLLRLLSVPLLLHQQLVQLTQLLVHLSRDVRVHFLSLRDLRFRGLVQPRQVRLKALIQPFHVLVPSPALCAQFRPDCARLLLDRAQNPLFPVAPRLSILLKSYLRQILHRRRELVLQVSQLLLLLLEPVLALQLRLLQHLLQLQDAVLDDAHALAQLLV